MADSKDVSTSLPSSSPPNTTPDPGFNPAGTFSAQWSNIFSYATGRMSRRTYDAWHAHLSLKTEAADCAACEKQRDYLLAKSPLVQYMQGQIRQLGGDLHSGNIRCLRCEKRQGGGFNPKYGIVICANEIRGKSKTEDTLVHEMIHAWDHLRWRVDWDDLRHAACSEVGKDMGLVSFRLNDMVRDIYKTDANA